MSTPVMKIDSLEVDGPIKAKKVSAEEFEWTGPKKCRGHGHFRFFKWVTIGLSITAVTMSSIALYKTCKDAKKN